jgi:hypothetical protein
LALWLAVALSLVLTTSIEAVELLALQPGTFVDHELVVPVDLVFIGYDRSRVDEEAILEILPATYRPVVQVQLAYGLSGRDVGLTYRFRYRFEHKSRQFEDDFFAFLARSGVEGPLGPGQNLYNGQINNVVEVTGPNLSIDAASVERYLAGPEGETQQRYTIFFINWYGRDGFRFHTYAKRDAPDPDTHYDFGPDFPLTAWGGSVSRTWFYDLSAGPDDWTDGWHVDDDQSTYRMPPIWEYVEHGYRPPAQLSRDLAYVTRFVAIDLLFTTSLFYDPLLTSPDVGGAKVAHIALFEDDPTLRSGHQGSRGLDWIDVPFIERELTRFQPYYPWKVGLPDYARTDAGADRALAVFAGIRVEDDCWTAFGNTFAQLFCYFDANLARYIPPYPPGDHVVEIFAYNTLSLGGWDGLLGFADDNWVDGRPTYLFTFDTPRYRAAGYGFTETIIHEIGHHFGLVHPHAGYDSELGLAIDPDQPSFAFTWVGDESHTTMSYMPLVSEYGHFDRDNVYRWEMAGYLNWTNAVLGEIRAHPEIDRVQAAIELADTAGARALAAFARWNVLTAAASARQAYSLVRTAAQEIGAPARRWSSRAVPFRSATPRADAGSAARSRGREARQRSKGNTRFQSSLMLTTVHPLALASSRPLSRRPMCPCRS